MLFYFEKRINFVLFFWLNQKRFFNYQMHKNISINNNLLNLKKKQELKIKKKKLNFRVYENLIFNTKKLNDLKQLEFLLLKLFKKLKINKYKVRQMNKLFYFRKRFLLKQMQKKKKYFRNWLRQKKQKKLSIFLYKYNKTIFFKKYRYRFKLLQYFFFRYTYTSEKIFKFLSKKAKMWFWRAESRYLNIEFFFRYQLYFFLKQLDFLNTRKQYSLRTKATQFYYLSFRKLKIILKQSFLKINNIKILVPFYQIFPFDLIEFSYAKFFQHITSFSDNKYLKTKSFFRKNLLGQRFANFNFYKRLKVKKYYFQTKKKKEDFFFSFFKFLKYDFKKNYFKYMGMLLKFFKSRTFYFFRFFFFERQFLLQEYEQIYFNLRNKTKKYFPLLLLKSLNKKKKKKLFLLRYQAIQKMKKQRILHWFSKFRFFFEKFLIFIFHFRKFKKRFLSFLPYKFIKTFKKKVKNFKVFKLFFSSLGRYFNRRYFRYDRNFKKNYKLFLLKHKRAEFLFKKKRFNSSTESLKGYYQQEYKRHFFFLQKKKSKYYLKHFLYNKQYRQYFLGRKKRYFKRARKSLIKRILFFKVLYFFFKQLKRKYKQKNLFGYQKNYLISLRILTYIPLILKKKKKKYFQKRKKKIFFLKSRDLRLLYFTGIYFYK